MMAAPGRSRMGATNAPKDLLTRVSEVAHLVKTQKFYF